MTVRTVSEMDAEFIRLGREHVERFLARHVGGYIDKRTLEIGPQSAGRRQCWGDFTGRLMWQTETLDIVPGADIQADITTRTLIADDTYEAVLCMEVLEHCVDPLAATEEIRRIAKDGALCLFSAPWNVRLHHPTPDLYRFSVHAWKVLLRNYDIIEIDALETPDRWLHPIHYCVAARVNKAKNVRPQDVTFEDVK